MKKMWFQKKAEQAEQYSQEKNHSEFYATLNEVYGPKIKNSHPVRSKGGVLLSTSEEIKDRCVEHFSELLNHHTEVDLSIVEDIEQHPINDSLEGSFISHYLHNINIERKV